MDAVDGRCRPLVELAGKVLHGDVLRSFQIDTVRHHIGDNLSEYAVAALLEKFGREAEKIVNIQQPERPELQLQIFVEFSQEALGLYLELRILFNENAVIHNLEIQRKPYSARLGRTEIK